MFFIKGPMYRILLLFSHIGLFLWYNGPVHYYSKLNAELRDLTVYYGDNSPCCSAGKESACNAGDLGLIPGLGRSPGEGRERLPTPVFWPGEFHGPYSTGDHKELDMTE